DLHGEASDIPIAGNWDPNASTGYSTSPASLEHFFPLGVDFQFNSSFPKWLSRGINTVVRVPCKFEPRDKINDWTAAANRLGLRMIRKPRANPAEDANEKNLLAWDICDEPEHAHTCCLEPDLAPTCKSSCDIETESDNLPFVQDRYR